MEDNKELATMSKIQQLENIVNGKAAPIDPIDLKSKLATFLLAHADKVMDTVAPLEQLREEVVDAFISKTLDMSANEETSPGALYNAIDAIQQMNNYAISTVKAALDSDKVSGNIVINATSTVNNTQHNSLNLNNALSRAKVTKAVAAINQLLAAQDSEIIVQGGEENDS